MFVLTVLTIIENRFRYPDPAAVLLSRIIVEFDANDNVIKAGNDRGGDGIFDRFSVFSYDVKGNLIKITDPEGAETAIAYDEIKNNFTQITMNTYGKKNFMIYQAETFVNNFLQDRLDFFPNLKLADTQQSQMEAGPSSYYFRKTETLISDGNNETNKVTTFYFN